MRSLKAALCACAPLLLGATSFTVNDADLVHVSGPGPVQVTNGTMLYQNTSENGSPWSGMYARNAGQQGIELEANAEGAYQLQIWSIPSDPMNPQRQYSTTTVDIGDGGGGLGPFYASDLLALLQAWGSCPPQGECTYDLDGNGSIEMADLLILLSIWN